MKLSVPFHIKVQTIKFRENYTGSVTLSPKGAVPRTYYFIVINPYGGKKAELSIYEDFEKNIVFAEAIGMPEQGYNPRTGLPITAFDFSVGPNDPKIGILWVLNQVISEGVYQAEVSGQGYRAEFSHYWEQEFSHKTTYVPESFLRSFGIPK